MALDFKEAVGEDDAAKEEFCEVQKNQVPKLAFIKTNLISDNYDQICYPGSNQTYFF